MRKQEMYRPTEYFVRKIQDDCELESGDIASPFLTSRLAGGEWSAARSCQFTPSGNCPSTHCIEGWVYVLSLKQHTSSATVFMFPLPAVRGVDRWRSRNCLRKSFFFFFLVIGVVWDLFHLVCRRPTGLFYQPRTIDDECGAVGGLRIYRGNRSTRRYRTPASLCPPQIPHDLTWARTRAAEVGSRRLTAWA
jgi:hypothetical protein